MNCFLILTVLWYLAEPSQCSEPPNSGDQASVRDSLLSLTSWLGHEMFYAGNHSLKNMALSGMSLMGTLLQMNSVASPQVSREIVAALGLSAKQSASSLCESFNSLVSAGSCYDRHNYSAVFYRNVFHDHSLTPNESEVGSACLQNYLSSIDFVNHNDTIREINEWYSYLPPYSERVFMTELFKKRTRFVFLNLIKSTPLTNLGYRKGKDEIHFYHIRYKTVQFDSMYKVGEYYYERSNNIYDANLLREDLPGGRYSLIFIITSDQSRKAVTSFKKIFTPGIFKSHFEAALALTKKTNITLTLPQISINTTVDFRRPLGHMCLTSLFTQDRALEKLFGSMSRVYELPHVASFHFTADEGELIETNHTSEVELNTPFWVILADRQKKVPLNSALFLGLGGTDKTTAKTGHVEIISASHENLFKKTR